MRKYLELFKEGFPSDMSDRTAIENWPYVGHDINGGVVYTVIPAKEEPSLYEAVDLGLPSGTKWANMNVGATSPEDAGLYFQWGSTIGYTKEQAKAGEVNWSNYFDESLNKYNNDGGKTVLDLEDDAAYINMGSDWRMPTIEETQELINNTTLTFIDLQDNEFTQAETQVEGTIESGNLKGIKLTATNGKSIFIPAAGWGFDSILGDYNSCGILLTSSLDESDLE